jgi:hypothetical protein
MSQPRKTPMRVPLPSSQPRQISITFESTGLLGLSDAEREKALTHLARLLLLAAGVAAAEDDDER